MNFRYVSGMSLFNTMRTITRYLCLMSLLISAGMAVPSNTAALQEDPAKSGDTADDQAPATKKPSGLLEVARLESLREKAARDNKIKESILQLGIYTDPQLSFVRRKRDEILAYGVHAVPHLIKAMESGSSERTRINAGRIAAEILAGIDDPGVEPALLRLLASENERARANAIQCIGLKGLKQHLELVKPNLKTGNKALLAATLVCLGRLGSEEILTIAAPYLKNASPLLRVAALQALEIWGKGGDEACNLVLSALANAEEPAVQNTALDFLDVYGGAQCVPVLIEKFGAPRIKRRERYNILQTLTSIGMRIEGEPRAKILHFLNTLLKQADFETVKKAAYHLNDLGDDSGVEVLTSSMDKLIATHGNAEYYFRRGEIFLQFKKYKDAKHDFQEGLRKDKKAGRYGAQKVFIALARCFAAENRFSEAERYLRKAESKDIESFPHQYEEFKKMAEDPRYSKLFEGGW
jgi:hypothetical protein